MSLVNPVPVFDFTVILTDATPSSGLGAVIGAVAGVASAALTGTFAEVSGLNAEMETEEYREGGRNTGPHKFIKWGKYPNLVFKRGVTPNTDLWDWYYQVLYGNQAVLRKNGLIVLTDRSAAGSPTGVLSAVPGLTGLGRLPIAVWSFVNGLPEKLQGPGLNAKSNEIAIETLEIAHEGLTRLGPAMVPGVGDVLGAVGGVAAGVSASISVSL
jgi:phage tail-like protein